MIDKLCEWVKDHKTLTIIFCILMFACPIIVVHILFRTYMEIPWLAATWGSGDVLAYVASFEAFLGTAFLGVVSLRQNQKAEEANKRLSEENNYLQKVVSQKMMPIVKLCPVKVTSAMKNHKIPDSFPGVNKFSKFTAYNTASPEKPVRIFCVNIDVESGIPAYVTTLTFSICNISEAIIRHMCVDDITICGYKGIFSAIRCSNKKSQNGVSSLFTTNDALTVQARFYFNSEDIKSCWDSEIGGLEVSLFLTNTTITGIKFQEFITIRDNGNGYSHISYGEGTFSAENEALHTSGGKHGPHHPG